MVRAEFHQYLPRQQRVQFRVPRVGDLGLLLVHRAQPAFLPFPAPPVIDELVQATPVSQATPTRGAAGFRHARTAPRKVSEVSSSASTRSPHRASRYP